MAQECTSLYILECRVCGKRKHRKAKTSGVRAAVELSDAAALLMREGFVPLLIFLPYQFPKILGTAHEFFKGALRFDAACM